MVLAAVLAGASACAGDSDAVSAPGGGDPTTVELSPPGTPLTAGLVVPVGARLIGPVFPRPVDQTTLPGDAVARTGTIAVLQLDGDPFAAWDDLAGQARAIGVPIAGSDICLWRITSAAVMGANPDTNPETPVSAARPDAADTLECLAAADGQLSDGSGVMVTMRLWWWAAGADLHVDVLEGEVGDSDFVWPVTGDPGPAPATAAAQLPERDAPSAVDAGEPFGRENNCFESGHDRLTLPSGARLVGGGTTPGYTHDFAAVLAVDDPEAVLGALRDQLDGPDSSDGHYGLGQRPLADDTPVWSLTGGVDAGGGGCAMWSSPDGTAVVVTTSSD